MPTSGSSRRWLPARQNGGDPAQGNTGDCLRDYDHIHPDQARHLIENFFAINSRSFVPSPPAHAKTARNFLAAIHLTAGLIWLN